ncbi:MAG: molybdopterin-dependent oxidoreductase [Planctomycetes bacterium]|nr:molybdopterin-dependent oxidoreductase [Planctomycetota bacterium]
MTIKSTIDDHPDVSRREFLKTSAATTAGVTVFATFFTVKDAEAITTGENAPDPVAAGAGENIVYRFSVCQNCHSRCGLMGKIVGPAGSTSPAAGVLVKLDGNPYHPNNMEDDERLGWSTAPSVAVNTRGRLCPKGQAGVQVLYDPYRIKHPLKRVGSRGSGKWQTISWATAFSEIATAINALIPTSSRLVDDVFPGRSLLGRAANALMFSPGRSTDGEIIERTFKNTYGTANYRLDHTSICEVSHHVSNELMTWDTASNKGRTNHFKPDIMGADYIVLFGANYLEANFPMLALSRKIAEFKKAGKTLVVVDPRFSNTAAKANVWLPARPGTDGAVALGMATHIIKTYGPTTAGQGAIDSSSIATYLRNCNAAAATVDNETTWTDAARLVIVGRSAGAPVSAVVGEYLRVQDYLPTSQSLNTNYAAWSGGAPVEIGAGAVEGELLPGTLTLTGGELGVESIQVKTVYEILYDTSIGPYSVQYYADIAGVDATQLTAVAAGFFAAGKRAVANPYRGTVQHTNGLWSMTGVMLLNTLAGNYDWQGGNTKSGGSWAHAYTAMSGTNTSGLPTGPRIERTKVSTTLYDSLRTAYGVGAYPYPAARPWFPYGTHGNYQEIIPSIYGQYPYACKVLITYWNALPYSTPALKNVFMSTVMDTSKVPLFVAIDNQMGEVSSYADYILPDTTYLEKWSFPGNVMQLAKHTPFRQPLVGSFDSAAWDVAFDPNAANNYNPIYPDTKMLEDILIGLMGALGLSNEIGAGTGGANVGPLLPANAWAHIKPALTQLVTSIGSASDPGKPAVTSESDIVARGGAFQDPGYEYDTSVTPPASGKLRYRYANEIKLYYEQLALARDVMASDEGAQTTYAPVTTNPAVAHYEPIKDVADNPISDATFPFQLITYKKVLHGQARTQNLPWLTVWQPENFIELNSADAQSLNLRTYDLARVTSASNSQGIVGHVWVTEGLRPGVVAISHHFGHWQQSSQVWQDNGVNQPADPSRALGLQPTLVMRLDPVLGDVSLQEKIGCSCSFYDTRVNVQKVTN